MGIISNTSNFTFANKLCGHYWLVYCETSVAQPDGCKLSTCDDPLKVLFPPLSSSQGSIWGLAMVASNYCSLWWRFPHHGHLAIGNWAETVPLFCTGGWADCQPGDLAAGNSVFPYRSSACTKSVSGFEVGLSGQIIPVDNLKKNVLLLT